MKAHREGMAVIGTYSFETAEAGCVMHVMGAYVILSFAWSCFQLDKQELFMDSYKRRFAQELVKLSKA